MKVIPCPEIREIDFGQVEGFGTPEVTRRFPQVHRLWLAKSPDMGYPGGETLVQLDQRIAGFSIKLRQHDPGETLLVVAHSGVLRTLICQLLEMDMRHRWSFRLDLASVSTVETYPQGSILTLLNDVSHLRNS